MMNLLAAEQAISIGQDLAQLRKLHEGLADTIVGASFWTEPEDGVHIRYGTEAGFMPLPLSLAIAFDEAIRGDIGKRIRDLERQLADLGFEP